MKDFPNAVGASFQQEECREGLAIKLDVPELTILALRYREKPPLKIYAVPCESVLLTAAQAGVDCNV